MAEKKFSCAKCKTSNYVTGELRTTGSGITRFLNLQNQRYQTISCANCGYTELYKKDGGGLGGNILDILGN